MNDSVSPEIQRIQALKDVNVLDTLPEQEYDDLTLLASQICETPIALVSLVDEDRQWFKSKVGLAAPQTPRDVAFCAHAIEDDSLFVVPDARVDPRFSANPLVTEDPNVVFYAGAPLVTGDGHALGTLCVIDNKPRELSADQERALTALARSTVSLLEARKLKHEDERAGQQQESTADEAERPSIFSFAGIRPYLMAAGIVMIAAFIKAFIVDPIVIVESPFLLFFMAVLLSAWRGGFGPGVLATILAAIVADIYFLKVLPDHTGHTINQHIRLFIFLGEGALTAYLCHSRLRNEKLAVSAQENLENRVARRTAELAQVNDDLQEEIRERARLQQDLRDARDAAIESAQMKSEFLANMSHEIRTPMNGVIGMTGLLLDSKLEPEQRRFAEIIRGCGDSLMTIINDILDLSKIEAGKLELETLDFNLRELVEGTVEIFSDRARAQQDELATLIYSDVPLNVQGDPGRIRQVLTNFIGNAIKFTKNGDIVVRVRKIGDTKNNVTLNFSVTDTGVGISDPVKAKLFQPFTQSDASTTRKYGGTGLGLSISKRLVELMNGDIGVESEADKGSTFWFTLTLEKQARPAAQASKSGAISLPLAGRRALIVDDNQVNREILTYQASSWAMEVEEASNAGECIAALRAAIERNAPVELVILDLQMPETDGLQTVELIRGMANETGTPPPQIIMISSSGIHIPREQLAELGISTFLTKPHRQNDLIEAIHKAFGFVSGWVPEQAEKVASIHATDADGRQKRILLVEDNQVNQMVAQTQLKALGYSVDLAANGLEALEVLHESNYDLILMDCQMPEMDGYEATAEIRRRAWDAAYTPVIALTAHAIDGEREKCLRAGMNDYISKPFEKEELQRMVEKWISQGIGGDPDITYTPDRIVPVVNATAAGEPVYTAIDIETLDDITGNDQQLRREVLEIYLDQTGEQLDKIEAAIASGDTETLYAMAHKGLGGSSICGMTAIVEPLKTLEKMGRENSYAEAGPVLKQARLAFSKISSECKTLLGEK